MNTEQINEIVEISNYEEPADLKINAYLKAGWFILNCAKQVDDNGEFNHEYLVYSLAWSKDSSPNHPEDI